MRLTVAMCTWNRAAFLGRALEHLARVAPPAEPWEVLVVDNGSTDGTAAVLDRFAALLPLRRVVEPALGLSNARNAAVAAASGDYIVWSDDDVLVDPGWLRAYERAVDRWPEAAVLGGPIRPEFEGAPPAWLLDVLDEVADAFAVRDLGRAPGPLDGERRLPYGANYAVRAREQRRFPYDPALGRRGHAGLLGEETAVIRAIFSSGGSGRWVPDASVRHWIPAERQTVAYLRRYFTLIGRTAAGRGLRLRPWIIRRYVKAECAYRLRRLTGSPRRWIGPMVEASILWGRLGHPAD